MSAEVAPQSQQSLEVCVPAEEKGGVGGGPQETAEPSRQQQHQEENTWVDRQTMINDGRDEVFMVRMEQLRDRQGARINYGSALKEGG